MSNLDNLNALNKNRAMVDEATNIMAELSQGRKLFILNPDYAAGISNIQNKINDMLVTANTNALADLTNLINTLNDEFDNAQIILPNNNQ